jgi:hypothetical protein
VPSRLEDPIEKVLWVDGHWSRVPGGRASVEVVDGIIYLVIALRNVGAGIAVLHGWDPSPLQLNANQVHDDISAFRLQTRDMYIAPGDTSFWQGAIRDPGEASYPDLHQGVTARQPMTIDLLYSDGEGGQRTVSRFALDPGAESDWIASVVRHFNLDRADPR